MSESTVQLEIDDHHVATITLNRPESLNAYNRSMDAELRRCLHQVADDPSVRAVVLTGRGRAFCAGADLNDGFDFGERGDAGPETGAAPDDGDRLHRLWRIPKPVICAVNGHAVGVGLTLALQADFRFIYEGARLSVPFTSRGIVAELGAHQLLVHYVGLQRAVMLLLRGAQLSGADAADWGLGQRCATPEDALTTAREFAHDLTVACSPIALATSKRLVWDVVAGGIEETMGREARAINHLVGGADVREGVAAFLEKRAPRWTSVPTREAVEEVLGERVEVQASTEREGGPR